MCVSQRRRMGCRGRCCPALPLHLPHLLLLLLLLLPLSFVTPPLAQGFISIPKNYKVHNMSQPPVLTAIPTSYTAFSPEDFELPCEATGNPAPTFRWLRNGTEFGPELQGSGTLRVEDDQLLESYGGFYRCYASNTLGTAVTPTVHIIVEPQPVLLKQQRERKRAYEGESFILSCNPPKSSVPPSIHWMDKRMVHIRQSERVTVGLNGNLYFANLVKSDSRDDYICNAQYAAARTILPESAVSLTVMSTNDVVHGRKPHFFHPSGPHSSVLALKGQTLTLECIPKGLPTPKVEWRKKDGSLEETGGEVDNHGHWLVFHSISQSADGEYQCQAANSHGSVTHAFTVAVEAAPYVVKEPQNLQYAPGETVRLDCQAEGIPTPTVTWSINGQPVAEVDREPRRSVSDGVLILRDVEFGDNAVYQCEATNKHGSVIVNAFLFVVELPPQILSSDGVVYEVIEGKNAKLFCESFGSPRPHITWEGEDMSPLLSDPRVSLSTDGTIELSNVSHSDSGVYTCSVRNTNISISANLEVFDRTAIQTAPQNVRVLRGTSALLDCGFSRDQRLRDFQVVWKKDGHKLQESSPDDKYTVFENNTLEVTDVQLHDTAQYSCEVITRLDHVDATGSITVIAPPEPPTLLSLSNVEDHSLTLRWTPGPSHNSPIVGFVVEAREEQHSEERRWRWEEWKKVPGDFNHVQLALHPYCTYRFRVTAVNEVGRGSPSQPSDDHSTPPAIPDSNPTGVRSNSSEPGTLVITWEELARHAHNGPGFQYKVSWREADSADTGWNDGFVASPPFVVNNTGTYTPFEISVKAVNAIGEGPSPEPQLGHSGEDKPEEPPSDVSSRVMNTTVRLSWSQAKKVRGLLLGYKIYVRRLGPQDARKRRSLAKRHQEEEREGHLSRGSEKESQVVVVVSGSKTSQEVTGLRLFSRYEISMTAFNAKGESPPSPPHHFETPEGAPGRPASLRFESPSESSLVLFWSPPLEPNGVLLGYMVQYQQEVESRDSLLKMEMISDPSVTHLRLDSLDPSSQYIFKVIARTAAGDGPPITRQGATLLDGVPPSNITVVSGNTSFNLSWVPGERDRNQGFHIQYTKADAADGEWKESEVVNSTQGFYVLSGLQPGSTYRLMVTHGNATLWHTEVLTTGPVPWEVPGSFATQGWLIGLISAIVLLVLILLILCLIKRSKGGKYAVKDKEDKEVDSEARPMKDETFGEYSDGDEKRSGSQPSLCGDSKLGSDDSLAEYGDSVDIQFNEDGSFIGQYSGRGPAPHGNESSGPASPVNAVPPPPIAPSMSSILNRPS